MLWLLPVVVGRAVVVGLAVVVVMAETETKIPVSFLNTMSLLYCKFKS